MIRLLSLLALSIFILPLAVSAQTSFLPHYSYDTHPNYWVNGPHTTSGRNYVRLPSSPTLGYDSLWAISKPHNSGLRVLEYFPFANNALSPAYEWELWGPDTTNRSAILHSYGGATESISRKTYATTAACQAGQTGHPWPSQTGSAVFTSEPDNLLSGGVCPITGGYIATKITELFGPPSSALRNSKCDTYAPASGAPQGNTICKISPEVGIVQNRYSIAPVNTNDAFVLGCEAVVYSWGYPFASTSNYRDWFRNGEVRFSDWLNLGAYSPPKAANDDAFWDAGCNRAWTEKANWLYNGIYQLSGVNYTDTGTNSGGLSITPVTATKTKYNISLTPADFTNSQYLAGLNTLQFVIDDDPNWLNGYGARVMVNSRAWSTWQSTNQADGKYYVWEIERGGNGWQLATRPAEYDQQTLHFKVNVTNFNYTATSLNATVEIDNYGTTPLNSKNIYFYLEGQDGILGVVPTFALGSETYTNYGLTWTYAKIYQPQSTAKPGDLNADGQVNILDLRQAIQTTDVFMYNLVVSNYGK